MGLLASGLQSALGYSLLGPSATYPTAPLGDLWQVVDIGYNPIPVNNVPPFITDLVQIGPKNIGEGYRRNSPVMYYTFDPSFADWFHAEGENGVQQAFDLLNNTFTNNPSGAIDGYSPVLSEFPLNSQGQNFTAGSLNLVDVKSYVLSMLVEQLGLTDAIRYTWTLHSRGTIPGCTAQCPECLRYFVVMRNYDYYLTPLGYVPPDWGQYSPYVNGELFGYQILEDCTLPNPPDAVSYPIPVNPTVNNPPVASGLGLGGLNVGIFYTGLTRDDVAGLRWLYSTNNYDTPSAAHLESPAAGSALNSISLTPQLLFTSNYNMLVSASLTNSPVALQGLFPGLNVGPNPLTYFSNVVSPNVIAYFTNFVGQPADSPAQIVVVTNRVTNIVQFYQNTFGNVVTNPFHRVYSNTTFAIQTITVGPVIGQPVGTPFVTNVAYAFFQSNVPSGDYFILSNGICNPNIIQILQTNVSVVTNGIVGITNVNGQVFVQNLVSWFTNYVFVTQPCTLVTNVINNYRGIGKMQFVRVPDYDYLSGFFTQPITNQYTMVALTNGQYLTQTFQRVITTPDFVFRAQDLENGPNNPANGPASGRNINLNQANELAGHAGPGTIDPTTTITLSEVGPDYVNTSTFDLLGPSFADLRFIWGSFDGTTNAPIVYPNGQVANLAAEALVQIAPPPPNLPMGTNAVAYTNALAVVAGGQAPYNWVLTTGSAGLPPGLNLSPNGVISGRPTQSGTFDNIVIQMTDSTVPIARTVNLIYSLKIN